MRRYFSLDVATRPAPADGAVNQVAGPNATEWFGAAVCHQDASVARKAVAATMLASAVGIDAGVEAHVGAVVGGDDGARRVAQEHGRARDLLVRRGVGVALVVDLVEPIGWIVGGAAPAEGKGKIGHGQGPLAGHASPGA